ncbi:MAG: hypothetical protein L0922_07880, partial [Candidatus Mariimomonas ferrooxydans]
MNLFAYQKKYIVLLALAVLLFLPDKELYACGGQDVFISDNPELEIKKDPGTPFVKESDMKISPALAHAIAERFLTENLPDPPLPLTFRKLENVHKKLIYQFQTEPLPDYKGQYHLGPVNFKVERLVLDVDALTGNLYLANGCGAAPGQLLYTYNSSDFNDMSSSASPVLVSNNTNFIARNTGNPVKIDGKILLEEWKNTGHKYFYLGTYTPLTPHYLNHHSHQHLHTTSTITH